MMTSSLLLTAALGSLMGSYCGMMQETLTPLLKGRVVVPSDNSSYDQAIRQYAYSSMPSKIHPSGVVYAQDAEDIKTAVQYAWLCDYRVVVRSGGHQYMGLSSCDSSEHKCMQIDMSSFKTLVINGTKVRVGAGVSLASLYNTLSQNGLFIGGGECATVHVGGHAQTGGYGFLGRAFGAFAQQVVAFDIVLSDGKLRHITKPAGKPGHSHNDQLFWAVLGGGAGSWGVVTQYEVTARRDADYPHATYYTCLMPWNKELFTDVVNAYNDVASNSSWDANHDEVMWVTTVKSAPLAQNFVKFEGMWVGLDGKPFDNSTYTRFVSAVAGRGVCRVIPAPISAILSQFKIFNGAREYPFPFEKRNQVTKAKALGSDFAPLVARYIDSLMTTPEPGLFLMMQLATGGGVMIERTDEEIALPFSSGRFNFDVGVFYSEQMNPLAKASALDFQDRLWAEVKRLPAFARDYRLVWATFGNVDIKEVWPHYFDTAERYLRLRQIKTFVDPFDMFRTSFTIPSLRRG